MKFDLEESSDEVSERFRSLYPKTTSFFRY